MVNVLHDMQQPIILTACITAGLIVRYIVYSQESRLVLL